MTKLVQNDIASLTNEQSALAALNSNYASLEAFSDTVLSRDGTTPNQMSSDLDMNSNNILNSGPPTNPTDLIRIQDVNSLGLTVNAPTLPGSSTNNAIVLWNGTAGNSLKNSVLTLAASLPSSNAALVTSSAGALSFNTSINTAHGSQFFTGNGTFTPAAGVYHVYAEVWGAGGGGGFCNGAVPASGGGGGGYAASYLAVTPGVGVTATIGAAGAAGTGTGSGGTGGTTTFSTLSATGGGGGGDNGTSAGGGGSGSGGSINLIGKTGSQTAVEGQSVGGNSPRGGLGGVTGIGGGAPISGNQPGGGGGGGSTNGASQNGAVGGAGGVLVFW